jgi:transcriptional regulator with XRE-family HTH domain
MSNFGKFLKDLRVNKAISLREFCRLTGLDPSNWSKVERGILPPPKNRKVVADIATVLMIEKGSEDWNTLFDLAAIGHIPAQLLAGPKMEDRLTIFFRAARGDKAPTPKQMKDMIEAFKGNKD